MLGQAKSGQVKTLLQGYHVAYHLTHALEGDILCPLPHLFFREYIKNSDDASRRFGSGISAPPLRDRPKT